MDASSALMYLHSSIQKWSNKLTEFKEKDYLPNGSTPIPLMSSTELTRLLNGSFRDVDSSVGVGGVGVLGGGCSSEGGESPRLALGETTMDRAIQSSLPSLASELSVSSSTRFPDSVFCVTFHILGPSRYVSTSIGTSQVVQPKSCPQAWF